MPALALAAAGLALATPVEIPERLRLEPPAEWVRAQGSLDGYAASGDEPPLAVLLAPDCPGAGLSVYEVLVPASDPDGALPYLRDLCLGDDATLREARTTGAIARITCDWPSHGRPTRHVYAAIGQPRSKVVLYAVPLACWDQGLEAAIDRSIASIRDLDLRPAPELPPPWRPTYARKSVWQQVRGLLVGALIFALLYALYRRLRRR